MNKSVFLLGLFAMSCITGMLFFQTRAGKQDPRGDMQRMLGEIVAGRAGNEKVFIRCQQGESNFWENRIDVDAVFLSCSTTGAAASGREMYPEISPSDFKLTLSDWTAGDGPGRPARAIHFVYRGLQPVVRLQEIILWGMGLLCMAYIMRLAILRAPRA